MKAALVFPKPGLCLARKQTALRVWPAAHFCSRRWIVSQRWRPRRITEAHFEASRQGPGSSPRRGILRVNRGFRIGITSICSQKHHLDRIGAVISTVQGSSESFLDLAFHLRHLENILFSLPDRHRGRKNKSDVFGMRIRSFGALDCLTACKSFLKQHWAVNLSPPPDHLTVFVL